MLPRNVSASSTSQMWDGRDCPGCTPRALAAAGKRGLEGAADLGDVDPVAADGGLLHCQELVVLLGQRVLHLLELLSPGGRADGEHRPEVPQQLVHLMIAFTAAAATGHLQSEVEAVLRRP